MSGFKVCIEKGASCVPELAFSPLRRQEFCLLQDMNPAYLVIQPVVESLSYLLLDRFGMCSLIGYKNLLNEIDRF